MSHYQFSFPLGADVQSQIDRVLTGQKQGTYPSASDVVSISLATNDAIIQALALDVIDILNANGDGGNILKVLAGLLKSTMHGLIRQLMGKLSHSELDKLAGYLQNRQVTVAGEKRFGFQMSEATGSRLLAVLDDIEAQRFDGVRQRLTQEMGAFVDVAVVNFFDELTQSLDLGFVAKKLVAVGRATVVKGSHSATAKLFVSMKDDELVAVGRHYRQLFTQG